MGRVDAIASWLNFFDIKTRHYALMSYATKQFDMNQLFLWKFFCGSIILTFSVVVPCMWIPWEGFTRDGHEHPPPLLHFAVMSGLLSSISMFVATFKLFRALDSSRFVVRRRIHACSWEMLDWVLYEVSTCATIVAFFEFWLLQMPASSSPIHLLRIEGVLVQFLVTCIDFFFTTPHFRKSHVFLALVWPSVWLLIQFSWILCGHQPASEGVDFHTWHSPLLALAILLTTIGCFFALLRIAGRLRAAPVTEDTTKPRASMEDSDLEITPRRKSTFPNSTLANYELMARSQRAKAPPIRESGESSDMESGVYRVGSDMTNSEDGNHVIAMGSWVGELPHDHLERAESIHQALHDRTSHQLR